MLISLSQRMRGWLVLCHFVVLFSNVFSVLVRAGVLSDLKNSEDQEEIRWEFPASFDRHSMFLFRFRFCMIVGFNAL